MRRRVDIKAILANPESRRSLLRRAVAFIIGVGADFRISHAEATARAACLHEMQNSENFE